MVDDDIISKITVTSRGDIKQTLEIWGVCIVPNVVDHDTCDEIINGMIWNFEFMTSKLPTPFIFENTETWETLELFEPLHNMLYQHWGIGQSQYIWDNVRSNPGVIDCFSNIWGSDRLIVSFDGISLHLPGELSGKNHFQKNDWYHFDQSPLRYGFECVQGLINAFDTNEGDATLTVLTRSHLYFEQYCRDRVEHFINEKGSGDMNSLKKEFGDNWLKVKELDYFKSKGCNELRIVCPKGSLVLWDSRTLHQGSQPLNGRPNPNFRAAVYVSMVPAHHRTQFYCSEKIFEKKSIEYVNSRRMTNHWPQFRKLLPVIPSSRYKKITDPGFVYPEPPRLTNRMIQLITGDYLS